MTFLTGASGSGKSTLSRRLQADDVDYDALFFELDSIGVPSTADMVAAFGSPAGWQRWAAVHWVGRLRDDLARRACVLDGQIRLPFIDAACHAAGPSGYRIVLVDCADAVRADRLMGRGQPELVTPDLTTWASLLRAEALGNPRADILDTSSVTVDEAARLLVDLLDSERGRAGGGLEDSYDGETIGGRPVTERRIAAWVSDAEAGHDVETLKTRARERPGRGAEPSQPAAPDPPRGQPGPAATPAGDDGQRRDQEAR